MSDLKEEHYEEMLEMVEILINRIKSREITCLLVGIETELKEGHTNNQFIMGDAKGISHCLGLLNAQVTQAIIQHQIENRVAAAASIMIDCIASSIATKQ